MLSFFSSCPSTVFKKISLLSLQCVGSFTEKPCCVWGSRPGHSAALMVCGYLCKTLLTSSLGCVPGGGVVQSCG